MINISNTIIRDLEDYQKLILKWNDTINLVSSSTIDDFWNRHIVDSLQLLKFIDNKDIHLVDIGAGAGLPGVVLSIAGIKKVSLIESDVKKCIFLKKASQISNNNIQIINKRVKDIKIDCDILTCRAFAPLNIILGCINNILVKEKFLLLKGKSYMLELSSSNKHWLFDYNLYNSVTSVEGKVLEISNLEKLYGCYNNSYS